MNKLGIIAGEGKFPILIAKEAASKGVEVFVTPTEILVRLFGE